MQSHIEHVAPTTAEKLHFKDYMLKVDLLRKGSCYSPVWLLSAGFIVLTFTLALSEFNIRTGIRIYVIQQTSIQRYNYRFK
jgi:hypothetical protein